MALYKGDVMLAGVSNGFNPASAGTTGQILTKTASGYDWDDAPDSANTKTFFLSSTSDLTNAQAAYDWYVAGKNPIIMYNNGEFTLKTASPSQLVFNGNRTYPITNSNTFSKIVTNRVVLSISSGTVTGISDSGVAESGGFLLINTDYSVPYVPDYDGSPATKKYVDDNAGIKLAPNSPLSPKYHWFGTEAQYQALSQYYTDTPNDTVYYTI